MANRKSRYQKSENKWRDYYKKWGEAGSLSPALGEKVLVTRYGWDHLINPRKRRSKVEKIKRLEVLPLAKKILETATTYQEHRHSKGIHYYAFVAETGGKRIKVVISSKGKGTKIFLSVIVLRG